MYYWLSMILANLLKKRFINTKAKIPEIIQLYPQIRLSVAKSWNPSCCQIISFIIHKYIITINSLTVNYIAN